MELTSCFIVKLVVIKMEIGEFSRKTGITIDTLRYYHKIGLLMPEKINNRRFYTEEDLEKARAIIKLKNLNFTLYEIKLLFDLEKDIDENETLNNESRTKVNECLNIIKEKYEDIIRKEKDLIQIKFALEKMINKTNQLLESGCFFSEKAEEPNCGEVTP